MTMIQKYKKVLIFLGMMTSLYIVILSHFGKESMYTSISSAAHFITSGYARDTSTRDQVVCKIKQINPFSEEVMKYMYDFREHTCQQDEDLNVTIAMDNFSVSGTGINYVRIRNITDHTTDGFRLGEFMNLKDSFESVILTKGHSGTIRNVASKRCIVPIAYDYKKPPREIGVMFSSNCADINADFTYTREGLIRHNLTERCLGPKGGGVKPAENTKLVISRLCEAKFDVIKDGVLQMVGTDSCVHRFGGGSGPPGEGEKLCLWPACPPEPIMYYHGFVNSVRGRKVENKRFPLVKDMSHVEVGLLNGKVVNTYMLSMIPKPAPPIMPLTRPNIIIICIEKTSAPHFKRKLKHTSEFMSEMGTIGYKKHAAVSPSSAANFMATLSGSTSEGTPENSIFTLARNYKYMSMLSADDPLNVIGTETNLAVDHNSLPFFRVLKKHHDLLAHKYCVSGQPIYNITFNYLLSFLNSYPYHAKLAVIMLSEICGPNFNFLSYMDKSLANLLYYLKSLKNTIVFIQTLKGGDDGKLRQLKQGLDELKRPLLSAYVSSDIQDKHKFEPTRSDQLSTPFDTYVTLRHLISQEEQKHNYGKSLLQTSKPRDCLQASVDPSMCPCV